MENLNISALSLQDFELFVSVAEKKSVSAGAQSCGVSQPTASYALDKLRRTFSDPLLVRSGQGMELTVFGEKLLDHCLPALENLTRLAGETDFDPLATSRNFKVMVANADLSGPYRNLTKLFCERAPNASISFLAYDFATLDKQLNEGLDLFVGPERPCPAGLVTRRLNDYPMVIYYDSEVTEPPATVEEMLGREFVRPQELENNRGLVDVALRKAGYPERNVRFTVSDYTGIEDVIAGTDLLFTASTIYQGLVPDNFAVAPLPLPCPPITHILRWSKRNDSDQGLQWLIDLFTEVSEANRNL